MTLNPQRALLITVLSCVLILVFCRNNVTTPSNQTQTVFCPSGAVSQYVLPYPVGKAYMCTQGFNGTISHYGLFQYAVDFSMPMGSTVTAARAGVVEFVDQSHGDDTFETGEANVVVVSHGDNTFARYCHLKKNGALVKTGQTVRPGEPVGLSGSSGSGIPHLHFDITKDDPHWQSGQTIVCCFRNTQPHPYGLEIGVVYLAEPY